MLLARMAATLRPPVRPARSAQQAQLAELINARDGLVRDRTALKNRSKNFTITMPELCTLDGKEAASLAELAPVARQSGQWKGKSFVAAGPMCGRPSSCQR